MQDVTWTGEYDEGLSLLSLLPKFEVDDLAGSHFRSIDHLCCRSQISDDRSVGDDRRKKPCEYRLGGLFGYEYTIRAITVCHLKS
jgi:hypothetical protein